MHRSVVQPEQRRLAAVVEQHTNTTTGDEVVVCAGGRPHRNVVEKCHRSSLTYERTCGMPMGTGTLRPARSVNVTVSSTASGALTKDTNHDSVSGSSSTPFHSHW